MPDGFDRVQALTGSGRSTASTGRVMSIRDET
jgi:hypothetical protein